MKIQLERVPCKKALLTSSWFETQPLVTVVVRTRRMVASLTTRLKVSVKSILGHG